ncbi:MAG: acid phosphatase [Usitatibacter sp.]
MRHTFTALIAALLVLSGCSSSDKQSTDDKLRKIEHIVVIYGENRSFDNLYGGFPGANGLSKATAPSMTQLDRDGTALAVLPPVFGGVNAAVPQAMTTAMPNKPFRIDDPAGINQPYSVLTRDLVHRFYNNQMQIDGGKLDKYAAFSDAGGLVMGTYDGSSLPLYKLAQQYTLADNFFMGAFGGSFLNHFWLVCACTPVYPDAANSVAKSRLSAVDPDGVSLTLAPDSPSSALLGPPKYVNDNTLTPDGFAINTMQPPYQPSGNAPPAGGDAGLADANISSTLPPQNAKTIGDTLTAKGVSWAWYAGAWSQASSDRSVVYNNTVPNFQAHHQPFNYFARFAPGTADRSTYLKDYNDMVAAIGAGTLPAVAFYKPQGNLNEHPGYAEVASGDAHIADVVAKIQASPIWSSTLIIITYDENGGYWDHVAPPKGDRWGPGTRVPTIIVSPFAKRGFVDSTPYDTTSVIKLITRRFGLEPLPGARAGAGDLTNALDF